MGHEAGDVILRETVNLMHSLTRPTDRICRIGGDEFAVIFYEPEGPRDDNSNHPEELRGGRRAVPARGARAAFPEARDRCTGPADDLWRSGDVPLGRQLARGTAPQGRPACDGIQANWEEQHHVRQPEFRLAKPTAEPGAYAQACPNQRPISLTTCSRSISTARSPIPAGPVSRSRTSRRSTERGKPGLAVLLCTGRNYAESAFAAEASARCTRWSPRAARWSLSRERATRCTGLRCGRPSCRAWSMCSTAAGHAALVLKDRLASGFDYLVVRGEAGTTCTR